MAKKLNIIDVKKWFLNRGSELLSEYKNNRSILKFKCSKCGTSEYFRFNSIIKSNSDCLCKECSKLKFSEVKKRNIFEVKKWFLDKKSKLLSEYKNCFSKVSFVCSKCGCVGEYHNFRRMFEINIECLCKGCSLKNRSGENNPNWNFDLTEEERNKNRGFINRWYYDWRREILRRYNNTCVITGGRGKNIVVHHLYNWKDFPEQRIFIDNGIPIKQEIHKRYHSLYGYKGNTPEQFMKFVEKYYGN